MTIPRSLIALLIAIFLVCPAQAAEPIEVRMVLDEAGSPCWPRPADRTFTPTP